MSAQMQQIAEQFTSKFNSVLTRLIHPFLTILYPLYLTSDFYYQTFDAAKDRTGLSPLYRDNSMLTWEGDAILGVNSIISKLNGLPFEKVAHKILTVDAQPTVHGSPNLLVLVTGQLIVDDSPAPMPYAQQFQLVQEGQGYFVQNDVFRLVYG